MASAMEGQGSQRGPHIHNGVDFNNPSPALLARTQYELLQAKEEINHWVAQAVEMEIGWQAKASELERKIVELDTKCSELDTKCSELDTKCSELERENGQLIMLEELARGRLKNLIVFEELDFGA